MIGPFRRRRSKTCAAVLPPVADPDLDAARRRVAELIRDADMRIESMLERLRARLQEQEDARCPPTS